MHPGTSMALGAAIVLSLCAVCAGLGAVVGPWFVVELYGVQLAASTGVARERTRGWIAAAFVVLLTVVVVSLAGWLAALGFGPDVPTADAATTPLPWPEALRRIGLIAGATALAVGFTAPFLYAPLILIDRGGLLGGALIESAFLVRTEGIARHLLRTSIVYALQLSPALLAAMFVARTVERSATPLGLLAALPLLTISIPLGQGIVTAAYLERRARLGSRRVVRVAGRPPRLLVALQITCIAAPILGLSCVGAAALRPATPRQEVAPVGEVMVSIDAPGARTASIAGTTLDVHLDDAQRLTITAGDGETVRVPRALRGEVERLRVVRTRDHYVVELAVDGTFWLTRLDRAGVRVDDTIRRRLEAHVPTWAFYAVLLGFLAGSLGLVRGLAPLGSLRSADGKRERGARERALRRAWATTIALTPFALAALLGGLVSLF